MPRKLGQHFLSSDAILQQIASAAVAAQPHRVIEIGPGRGALTRYLAAACQELHAIEIDRRLADLLTGKFSTAAHVFIHHGDVLDTDLTQWGEAAITGNLPYYITSPIIEKFLKLDGRFSRAVFLVQWEVALRLLAKPRTRDYGYLTVSTQTVCEVELVCKAPASAFSPPPKVESAAVLFKRRAEAPANLAALLQFAGRCFKQKRKTLRNNLRPYYGAALDGMPEAGLRAEQLQLDQFGPLLERLEALKS